MTKFYVESGVNLRVVILARNPVDAILRAIAAGDALLELDEIIIVNQRGFVSQRPGRELRDDDLIYPTQLLLDPPDENGRVEFPSTSS
ncbi:MAG: hypothetical protein ACI9G1_002108 [Pirellulaceae bacterium]|jgi:hypothetical protein